MSFLNPEFIYLMFPPLLILAYFVLSGGANYEKYFNKDVLDKILIRGDILGTKGRSVLFLLAFALFILALARPISDEEDVKVQNSSKNLVIAIDISRSMLVNDIYPTRLEFVKNRLKWLINKLPNTNIGITAFAKDAFLVSPVTSDKNSLEFLLDGLSPDIVSRQGTDITNALKQISKMFPDGGVKDVFIISDGGEEKDVEKSIDEAKKDNLHVSVMVVGTKDGGAIKTKNGLLKDRDGKIVISKRNDSLLKLSEETGGVYIKEFGSGGGVNLLEKSLSQNKDKNNPTKEIKTQKEWFMIPLVFGFLLVSIAFHGLPNRKILTILPFLFVIPSHAGMFDFLHLKKANDALKNKEYQKAIDEYNTLDANPQINYNKANAYYKMKKYDEALKEYKKVKTNDKDLKAKALFNEGNAYVQKQKLKEALKSYENALKLSPNDEDIKKNIEYVKRKMQEKKKKQQNKDDKNQKNKNNKNQQNKNDKKQNNQDKNKQNKEDKKQQNRQNKNDNNQTKKPNQQKNKKDENQTKKSQKQNLTPKKSQKPKDLEGEKWEKILKSIHPKTQPVKLGKDENVGEDDEITW